MNQFLKWPLNEGKPHCYGVQTISRRIFQNGFDGNFIKIARDLTLRQFVKVLNFAEWKCWKPQAILFQDGVANKANASGNRRDKLGRFE